MLPCLALPVSQANKPSWRIFFLLKVNICAAVGSSHIIILLSNPKPAGDHFIKNCYLQDINSPTDSVIGRDFQELSAEEQERQREEWKAELKKTEEEILTLKQVLTAKERHAAGKNLLIGSNFL